MKGNLQLSVAIITKDEEKNLPDYLATVSFADDIVVIDSGSRDRTVEIAEEFGCRVFVEEWKGYGPQKNSAIDKCKHKWVLTLDADERVPVETRGSFSDAIHEKWITEGRLHELDACIEHYSFSDYSDMLKVLNAYSSKCAEELFASGKRATFLTPVLHGVGMFLKIYLLKKGFLDGMDGFVTAITKAGGAFFKYAKLIELQNKYN